MKRIECLKYCKICEKKQNDLHKGIICRLTGNVASFEGICPGFSGVRTAIKIKSFVSTPSVTNTKQKDKISFRESINFSLDDILLIFSIVIPCILILRIIIFLTNYSVPTFFYIYSFMLANLITLIIRTIKTKKVYFFNSLIFNSVFSISSFLILHLYIFLTITFNFNLFKGFIFEKHDVYFFFIFCFIFIFFTIVNILISKFLFFIYKLIQKYR